MIYRVKIEELPRLVDLCKQFSVASKIKYIESVWLKTWTTLITSGIGTILILDDYAGMLGAIVFPDPNCGDLIATEMFWWVDPLKRGNGIKLLVSFEKWAKENGCKRAIMVHLKNLTPKRLAALYKKRRYIEVETHFVKEL